MKEQPGVYFIQNIITKKMYIGASISINTRLQGHKTKLRCGKHVNCHLQNSYNIYGEDNFIFETLEECDKEYIFSQENYWCNLLNTHDRRFGYNVDPTSPIGKYAISEETKIKMGDNRKDKREIYCYTIYGDFYMKFGDFYKCATHFNTAAGNIHRKMNILFNKRNLIDSMLTKYIVVDKNIDISEVKTYWDSIFNQIRNNSGKYKVYNCFGIFVGNIDSRKLCNILNIGIGPVTASIGRNSYIRTLKITR